MGGEKSGRRKQRVVFCAALLAYESAKASYSDLHLTARSFTNKSTVSPALRQPQIPFKPSQHRRAATRIPQRESTCNALSNGKGKIQLLGSSLAPELVCFCVQHVPLVRRRGLITKVYQHAGISQPAHKRQPRQGQWTSPAASTRGAQPGRAAGPADSCRSCSPANGGQKAQVVCRRVTQ